MVRSIREGWTARDGQIPINTLGGVIGRGHPAYVTPLYETIDLLRQLRGEAGPHQVDGATVGLMQCEGGMLNNCLVMLLQATEGRT